ncbi:MAG: laccase domain-containing protein [Actinobacteria bacterium]|nr:laccase domain-containing protein [Actinomycetota bacterium]MCG2789670.1 laccase domain-containing protein [Actinomycetes bacterium]
MKLTNLLIALSLREDKNMKVYYEFGKDDRALINRERFLNKLGLSEKNVISVKSVNGDNIEIVTKKDGKSYVDLKLIAKRQLEEAGIKPENIDVSSVCTYCQADTYFSYRKDKSEPLQAMMIIAGMK